MGRTSASLKVVHGGASSRRDRAGRGEPIPRSADQNRVVPWKEMERRVAERIAAKAARGGRSDIPPWKTASASASGSIDTDRPPDSGVRSSEPGLAAARPLTFTVYSVEELDARQRLSAPPPSAPPPPPSRWPDVWRSTKTLMHAWWAWYKTPKPRSRLMDVCGVPVATLKSDLFAALKQLPWRKIAIRGAIGVGSFLFLLFIVLTAAELTDDLKPGAPRQLGTRTTEVETPSEAAEVQAAIPVVTPVVAPSVEPPVVELDEPAPAAPAVAKKATSGKKPAAAKKKR